jgi:hypothetical protein
LAVNNVNVESKSGQQMDDEQCSIVTLGVPIYSKYIEKIH